MERADSEVRESNKFEMKTEELYRLFLDSTGVTTDSRNVREGEIFFALKGENFDGSRFAEDSLKKGAVYAVVDESSGLKGERIITVPDVLSTLQGLARYHREHTFVWGKRLTVIGLTGTNGKTTTKNLITSVLSKKYNVTATRGNLNNDIGVPLSLLRIDSGTEMAVIEMGASHPDDIAHLVEISRPDYGLITNVGKAHLQGFGSFEGVKKAKGQLYDFLNAHGGIAFVNVDDQVLEGMAAERNGMDIIPYGLVHDKAAVLPYGAENPFLSMDIDGHKVSTRLVGSYNASNVLAAIAVGMHFGVSLDDAISAVEEFVPDNNRSQMAVTAHNTVIEDAYNANPSSMAAALDNFAKAQAAHKCVMLGDMRELGDDSLKEHETVIRRLKSMKLSEMFLVGEEFRKAADAIGLPDNARLFATSDGLAAYISKNPLDHRLILVKGSRGIQMEKVIPEL